MKKLKRLLKPVLLIALIGISMVIATNY